MLSRLCTIDSASVSVVMDAVVVLDGVVGWDRPAAVSVSDAVCESSVGGIMFGEFALDNDVMGRASASAPGAGSGRSRT